MLAKLIYGSAKIPFPSSMTTKLPLPLPLCVSYVPFFLIFLKLIKIFALFVYEY